MRCDKYTHMFTKEHLMGPNCMVLLDELLDACPIPLAGKRLLDLGCGMGVTTLLLAKETGARQIFATDLWISAQQMQENFTAWGVDDVVVPIHADANDLPYAPAFFDAIVSVDAYHYFGRDESFFAENIWPLVRPGGCVMLSMPGTKKELDGVYPQLMVDWAGDEAACFCSLEWWKKTLCHGLEDLESVNAYLSNHFDRAWGDWFASGHEYGQQDKAYFDKGLGEHLSFVSVVLKKKEA